MIVLYILIAVIVILIIALIITIIIAIHNKQAYNQNKLNWANSIIYLVGFEYVPSEQLYTTRQDALQRLGGYNSLYDDLSTLLYMPIDIEPIKFSYGGKNWMIELWKGQYFPSTGCEIGIYIESPDPGRYYCATDADMVYMSYTLMSYQDSQTNPVEVFSRSGVHWWLTGFKPGVCSDPTNLSMENINIRFNSQPMAQAFYDELVIYFNNPGEYKYAISGNTVSFRWHKTIFSPQPNLVLRPQALDYDCKLATAVNAIMNKDFSPDAINNKILETIAFLETDDNMDKVIDWFLHDTTGNSLDKLVSDWDNTHPGDNIQAMLEFGKYLKMRATLGGMNALISALGLYCKLNPTSPICPWMNIVQKAKNIYGDN